MWSDGQSNTLSDRSKEPQGTVSFVVEGRCLGTARTGGWKLSQGLQNDHSLLCFSTKPYNMKRWTSFKNEKYTQLLYRLLCNIKLQRKSAKLKTFMIYDCHENHLPRAPSALSRSLRARITRFSVMFKVTNVLTTCKSEHMYF